MFYNLDNQNVNFNSSIYNFPVPRMANAIQINALKTAKKYP